MKKRKNLARKTKVKAGPSPKPRSSKLQFSAEENSPSPSGPEETGEPEQFVPAKPKKTKKQPRSAPKKRKR
jgi:hypothetical protein